MFDEKTFQAREDDELRAWCQRLADELTAPLPPGDEGIFEALRRWEQYIAILDDKAGPLRGLDYRQESEIVAPVLQDRVSDFFGAALDAEPEGPQAAAALIHHFLRCAEDDPDDLYIIPGRLLLRIVAMCDRFMGAAA